jgi:hypothetical protein
MLASDVSRSAACTSTPFSPSNASRNVVAAGEPSSSAQPSVRPGEPPPWKISPNMKMKISGNASVQNRAARSRV